MKYSSDHPAYAKHVYITNGVRDAVQLNAVQCRYILLRIRERHGGILTRTRNALIYF